MATYYVRKTGSDAAAGTSAGAAWLTIGKALGAAGIASGDTVYIGAGVYREVVTVNMTSATAETFVIGDVDGVQTGDAGEVQWTGYTTNDVTVMPNSILLLLNGRDFLTIKSITFIHRNNAIEGATATSTDIKIQKCNFISAHTLIINTIVFTTAANVTANWVIDSCIFLQGNFIPILPTLTRPATADFDVGITIKNCYFQGSSNGINFSIAGANTFNPGGAKIYNCTFFGMASTQAIFANSANFSTTIPILVYNCLFYTGGTAVYANTSGQITEDYNLMISGATPRTNVTAGTHSVSDGSYAPLFFNGFEYSGVGANLMPFGMPKPGSPLLGFGNQAATVTTDLLGATRPSGFQLLSFGTATAGGAKTLTDSGKTWGTNSFAGATVKIISGTGSGQTKSIASNTATVLTVDGNWKTNPSTDSVYEIYKQAMSSSGTATAGSTTSLTDSNAAWGVNMWHGYTLEIDSGTGSPQSLLVTTNTATVLSFATATAPDNTSTYKLYRGTSENVINAGVGCYEYGSSGVKETTTVRTGSSALRIPGAGYQDFVIPVDATSTTITIYTQFDSAYSGTKPSMNIINGTECGVTDATSTAVGSAGSFEQLSLNFTPTAAGVITVRLLSSSTTPTGNAFFDDFAVA